MNPNLVLSNYTIEADFPRRLRNGSIEFADLSIMQRVLLMTDGTLTKMLEVYAQEHLQVVKLREVEHPLADDIPAMWVRAGEAAIHRTILLSGQNTQRNWLYAESIILPDRLDLQFRYRLLSTRVPIGRLWSEHKLETFKETIRFCREEAGEIADHFDIAPQDTLLSRTYLVNTNYRPTMMITEKFPEALFV